MEGHYVGCANDLCFSVEDPGGFVVCFVVFEGFGILGGMSDIEWLVARGQRWLWADVRIS